MARRRSAGSGKTSTTIDRVAGMIRAAPTPSAPRASISCRGLSDIAAAKEATPKTTRPAVSTRLRPKRSPRLPEVSNSPANTRM